MKAHIYRPSRSAMQSGRGKIDKWILEYDSEPHRGPEPLMGWTSSDTTLPQVQIKFDSKEDAIRFAQGKGWDFHVTEKHGRKVKPRNYVDNFVFNPRES